MLLLPKDKYFARAKQFFELATPLNAALELLNRSSYGPRSNL